MGAASSPIFHDDTFTQHIVSCILPKGEKGYMYILAPQEKEQLLMRALKDGVIPPYAVVVAAGAGQPSEETQHHMERCYGFASHHPTTDIICNLQLSSQTTLDYC